MTGQVDYWAAFIMSIASIIAAPAIKIWIDIL